MDNDNLEKEIVFSQENLNEIEINVETENFVYNVLQIGEVKEGDTANATITGKEPNQILNLVLPKGIEGPKGDTGSKGNDGYTPIKGTDYWTTSDKQEIVNDVLNEIDIPTSTEDLTNDSGFITNTINDLVNYYLKSETYSKNEVNTLISNITKVTISIVDALPTTGESNVIYFVPKSGSTNDVYDEYVWISNQWEHIGSTNVDLTGYATIEEIPTKVSELQNDSGFITGYTETDPTVPNYVKSITQNDITNWNNKSDFSGNYEDLTNKPTIPSDIATTEYVDSKIGSINIVLSTLTTISEVE